MGFFRLVVAKYEKKIANYNFMISFPKSGRTWVRYFLNNYFFYKYPFSVTEKVHTDYKNIPLFRYSHAGHSELTKKDMIKAMQHELSRIVFKYDIIYTIRDPRDVFISYYYQLTKRDDLAREKSQDINWEKIPIEELLYSDIYGIKRIVDYMNTFYHLLRQFKYDHFILQYEMLKANPYDEFSKLLIFLNDTINERALEKAIESSSFNKMKDAEKNNLHELKHLQSASEHENSMKVRKGQTGEYKKYFNKKDLAYINQETDKLIPELRKRFE